MPFLYIKEWQKIFQKQLNIYLSNLPNSDYELDTREHFELLGVKYNPIDINLL